MLSAFITGVAGTGLTGDETAFLTAARPCGFILFARNCHALEQIQALTQSVKDAVGSDILILIDQEGGRVQRIRPPLGRELPPAAAFGALFDDAPEAAINAARSVARLIAHDLKTLGINTNCAPVLDVPSPGSDEIIGDRAYGADPEIVECLGRAVAEGYLAGGVLPVVKHIPGHGRAGADSHLSLPVVATSAVDLDGSDFRPFKALADLPAAMTAHILYSALDPEHPVSTSPTVISNIIRGRIGFDGLLMSDDLSMKALRGDMSARGRAAIAAGCDVVLHCNGDFSEMEAVASAVPVLEGRALERFDAALSVTKSARPFDLNEAEKQLKTMLSRSIQSSESV